MNDQPAAELSRLDVLLGLGTFRIDQLRRRGSPVAAMNEVVGSLHGLIEASQLYRVLVRETVESAIVRDRMDEAAAVLRTFILPYAVELSTAPWRSVQETLRGLLLRAERQEYQETAFSAPWTLGDDRRAVRMAVAELRVVAAVDGALDRTLERDRIISLSSGARMLSLNSPMHLLVQRRWRDIDAIVDIIRVDGELHAGRIEEMLNAGHGALRSGAL